MAKPIEDLYGEIAESTGHSVAVVRNIVHTLTQRMSECLSDGETVMLFRLGTFRTSERGESLARNMQTGETIVLPARRRVSFKASKTLRARLQGHGEQPEVGAEAAD